MPWMPLAGRHHDRRRTPIRLRSMAAWAAEAFSRLVLFPTADSVVKHALATKTDEALLVSYREGNREAFVVLLERYRGELLNFLTKFLSNRAAAEDVFQETFLQVHLSAESFDEARTFKPWLFTIAANKARDFHRRQKRRATASLSAPVNGDPDGGAFIDLLDGGVEQPSAPIERGEEAGLVKQVVERLPSHYREILLLSYFQRMSYQQIAEILEVPLGTVKSRLHSAVACFADGWRVAVKGSPRERSTD